MTNSDSLDSGDLMVNGVDPEVFEIIPLFLEQIYEDLQSIKQAMDCGDYETIRVLGHNMNGSAGGFGFDLVSDLGCSLEKAAMQQNAQKVRQLSDELTNYINRIAPIYA